MRSADLHQGDEVFVRLPYEGGVGWVEVLDPRAVPETGRPGATVRVRFLPGEGPIYNRERLVRPADCHRRREHSRAV